MIDIHAHVLPGVDDGSYDMATSLSMAGMAVSAGTTRLILTPHCNQVGRFENYVSDDLLRQMDDLKNEIEKEHIPLQLGYGMEIFCTREVPRLLKEGKLLTLNGSRYALVEFAFGMEAFRIERMVYSILDSGYVPVVAHAERYLDLQNRPELINDWMEDGIGIQMNKGSLFGRFGYGAYQCAHMLLQNGLVSCIASDAHGIESRTTDMAQVHEFLSTEYSEALAEHLLTNNPRRIFEDQPLYNG